MTTPPATALAAARRQLRIGRFGYLHHHPENYTEWAILTALIDVVYGTSIAFLGSCSGCITSRFLSQFQQKIQRLKLYEERANFGAVVDQPTTLR
jgi:hypothetical protein